MAACGFIGWYSTGSQNREVYRRYAIVSEAALTEGVKKLAALTKKTEKQG